MIAVVFDYGVSDEIERNAVSLIGFKSDKDKKYFKDYFLVSAVLLENSKNPIISPSLLI